MYLINKKFNNETITTICDNKKIYISVVDLVDVVLETNDKQAYWRKLKYI
ncbi:MAG: hypothetical protein IKE90_01935 [Bacilli bacterium]|nr:hypothetical protein [Bacilli bacterium]